MCIKTYKSETKHNENGFTLLELLIAMVIFLIVTTSIYGLLSMGTISKNRTSRRSDVLKNARSAIHIIGRDALNAGLGYHKTGAIVPDGFISETLRLPADRNNTRDLLTSVIAGNDIFSNDLQNENTDTIAFAYRDQNFNSGDAIGLDRSVAGTSDSTIRLQLNSTSNTNNINKYDLVLVESDTTQAAVIVSDVIDNKNVDFATTDPLMINQNRTGTGINRSILRECDDANGIVDNCTRNINSLKRFFWVSYEVKENGTLVRKTYGNNTGGTADQQVRERPLAYNVSNLQFSYVLENGTVTDDPGAGPDGIAGTNDDTPELFNLIRQITVTVEVQSTEDDEQTGRPDTITLQGTFSTRNLEYDLG